MLKYYAKRWNLPGERGLQWTVIRCQRRIWRWRFHQRLKWYPVVLSLLRHQHQGKVRLDLADSRVLQRPIACALQPRMLVHSVAGFIGPQVSSGPKALTFNLHPFRILHLSQILPLPQLNDLVVQTYGASIILIVYVYISISCVLLTCCCYKDFAKKIIVLH